MTDEPSFDLAAAGLRADGADLAIGIEVLAHKLEVALPQETRVERRSKRLFSKDKVVEAVEVALGDCRYVLRVRGRHVDASRAQEVRGVVIKREALDLHAWVESLTAQLSEQATTSAAARAALARLVD